MYMQHTESMAVQTQRCIHTKAHISALMFTDLHIFTLRCMHTLAVPVPTFLWAFPGSPINFPWSLSISPGLAEKVQKNFGSYNLRR